MKKLLILIAAFTVSLNNAAEFNEPIVTKFDVAVNLLPSYLEHTLKTLQYDNATLLTNWKKYGPIIDKIASSMQLLRWLKIATQFDNSLRAQHEPLIQEVERYLKDFDEPKITYIDRVNHYCGHAIAMVHPNFNLARQGSIQIQQLQEEARTLSDEAVILENEALISQVQSAINHRLERFIRIAQQALGATAAE